MRCSAVLVCTALFLSTAAGAQSDADFGDAPDDTSDSTIEAYGGIPGRFPTLLNTSNAAVPGNRGAHHLMVNEEWLARTDIAAPTTTSEADANIFDNDADDALVHIFCVQVAVGGAGGAGLPVALDLCFLQVNAIHVGAVAPDVPRYVNALVDVNRNGRWDSALPFGTFPREHVIVDKAIIVPADDSRFLMSGPFVITGPGLAAGRRRERLSLPIWVRVTLTRVPLGIEGWDGSAPPGGFDFGETEDHLVTPLLVPPGKEPSTHFKLRGPGVVVIPAPVSPPPNIPFAVDVLRIRNPRSPEVTATDVRLTLDRCFTFIGTPGVDVDPGAPPGVPLPAQAAGMVRNDVGVIRTKISLPGAAPGPPDPPPPGALVATANYTAGYPPLMERESRATLCWISLAVDPNGEIVEYDYPFNSELPIRFLEADIPDGDQDGVPDESDQCADAIEDLDGFDDDDGCPDPDNDADGVADENDICPVDIEDRDGFADADGCPDPITDAEVAPALSLSALSLATLLLIGLAYLGMVGARRPSSDAAAQRERSASRQS